jgi:tetratricopeptide (TPR) repeat protein
MTNLAEKVRPIIEKYGTPAQRATFLWSLVNTNLRRDRYVVSEETLALGQAALAINLASGTPSEIISAQFNLGFALLWYGDLDEAEKQLLTALSLAERTGDVWHYMPCLTYLTVTYRKQDQAEKVREYSSRSLTAATDAHRSIYIGAAKANLAWLAGREGNLTEAEALGQAALKSWRQLPPVYPFHWLTLWPLIGVALAQDQVSEAIDQARGLLELSQQRLPEALAAVVEEALQAWDASQPEMAKFHLNRALEIAQEMNYA